MRPLPCNISCGERRGFTLIEVLAAVAIAGLVTAAGFKLIALSLRTLSEVSQEHALMDEAQKIHLDFLVKEDMPDQGERDGVKWRTEQGSAPVEEFELRFRKLIVEYQGRTIALYLPR